MSKNPLKLTLKRISNLFYNFYGSWEQPGPQPQVTQPQSQAQLQPQPQVTQPGQHISINEPGLKLYAPYVDILLWPTINLIDIIQKTGHKFFTLAFIVADNNGAASWGGVIPLEQKFFMDQINKIRNLGGDIIISLGGLNGTEIALANNDVNKIVEIYQSIIDIYKLKYIDFDIEGFALHEPQSIDRRNKAIKIIQERNPDLKVAYCLPVTPDGLSNYGFDLLKNAVQNNVKVDLINIMTMNYGTYYSTGKDLGVLAIECAKQTYNQSKTLGIECEIGLTPMIGVNDISTEVFTQQHAKHMIEFCIQTPWITLVSNWSLNRDTLENGPLFKSSQIKQDDYEFLHILRKIQSQPQLQVTQPQPQVTKPQLQVTQPQPQLQHQVTQPQVTQPQPQLQHQVTQPQVTQPQVTQPQPQLQHQVTQPQVTQPQVTQPQQSTSWKIDISYNIGDIVDYNGTIYKCLQPHISHSGWSPETTLNVLWIKINNNISDTLVWSTGTLYKVDDIVIYNNSKYTCYQSHMSQTNWNPQSTINILWKN